jgi:hypothetical protein
MRMLPGYFRRKKQAISIQWSWWMTRDCLKDALISILPDSQKKILPDSDELYSYAAYAI